MIFIRKAIIFISIFILSSCSEKQVEVENQNQRFSVLKYDSEISETLTLDISEINLDPPKEFYYWSKDLQNPQNNLGHIFTKSSFHKKKKIVSGMREPLN